jgi:hypothetical protein
MLADTIPDFQLRSVLRTFERREKELLALLAETRDAADVMSKALALDECTIPYEQSVRIKVSAVLDSRGKDD